MSHEEYEVFLLCVLQRLSREPLVRSSQQAPRVTEADGEAQLLPGVRPSPFTKTVAPAYFSVYIVVPGPILLFHSCNLAPPTIVSPKPFSIRWGISTANP